MKVNDKVRVSQDAPIYKGWIGTISARLGKGFYEVEFKDGSKFSFLEKELTMLR